VPGIGALLPPLQLDHWRNVIGQYYAMVSSFDRDVGRILDELERTGALKNTIIVFSSDNGLALSDHGLIHKSSLYEHEVKLPLIVCGPGVPAGKRSDAFVYVSDMFPTLCEMTGAPIPNTVQTKSFRTSVFDPAAPARPMLTFAYTEEMRAFRDDRYKIILYNNHIAQLFDLKTDPLEIRDLAKDSAHAQRLAAMIEQARSAFKADGDVAGKKVANLYRRWPQTACRLEKDGPMLWEIWGTENVSR
jgi:arylsulfatase A-like enzyme